MISNQKHSGSILFSKVQKQFCAHINYREGPKLNIGRNNHACYVHRQSKMQKWIKNIVDQTYIGVYGGMRNFYMLKSTEFLFSDTNEWQVGPNLFRKMMDSTAVFFPHIMGPILTGKYLRSLRFTHKQGF